MWKNMNRKGRIGVRTSGQERRYLYIYVCFIYIFSLNILVLTFVLTSWEIEWKTLSKIFGLLRINSLSFHWPIISAGPRQCGISLPCQRTSQIYRHPSPDCASLPPCPSYIWPATILWPILWPCYTASYGLSLWYSIWIHPYYYDGLCPNADYILILDGNDRHSYLALLFPALNHSGSGLIYTQGEGVPGCLGLGLPYLTQFSHFLLLLLPPPKNFFFLILSLTRLSLIEGSAWY